MAAATADAAALAGGAAAPAGCGRAAAVWVDDGAVGEIVRVAAGVNRGAHHDEAQPVPRTRCGGAAALVAIVLIGLAGLVVRRRLGRRCGGRAGWGGWPGRLPPKGTAEEEEEQVQVDVALVRLVDDYVRVRAETSAGRKTRS